MPTIDAVDVHRLRVPLTTPYRLAFGPVNHYDTIIAELRDIDGRHGFGEATLLTGYTEETIDGSWTLARELSGELAGAELSSVESRLDSLAPTAPFVCTAYRTALDMLRGHALLTVARLTRVPILGLLQGKDEIELGDQFERLLGEGYRTVKIKVGFDVGDDLAYVARVQHIVRGRAAIRVDANQGYSPEQAAAFVRGLDPAGIELFEQPCAAGDWEAHRAAVEAASRTGLSLMLDESIYAIADIERAAREGACRFVKVKLMKFGGLDALVAAIERIRALELSPVLGNGVACDVSCWMEACVAAQHIDNAGEMNGFRKARRMLLAPPLVFDRGDIVLMPRPAPVLDPEALTSYCCDRLTSRRTLAVCASAPSSPA
jgi:L-Ala-D/L-Glu epimerase / N-acetyl-D-glutamate racemase